MFLSGLFSASAVEVSSILASCNIFIIDIPLMEHYFKIKCNGASASR